MADGAKGILVRSRFKTTRGIWRWDDERAQKLSGEPVNSIGQLKHSVVIHIRRIVAGHLEGAKEKVGEEVDGIGELTAKVV